MPLANLATPETPPDLPVLHRDAQMVAIDKPSGLLVHRSPIDRHETRFAVQLLRDQLGQRVYPVHRLDKGTSGVLLFALDRESAATLAAQFSTGEAHKRYLAVVRGWPLADGLIDHALRDPTDTRLGPAPTEARSSRTRYRRVATAELPYRVDRYPTARYALVEVEPLTGRRHQIRRHLAHVSHPVIGDSTYGKGRHNRLFRELFGVNRLLLACVRLELRHPLTGATVVIEAPLTGPFASLVERLGWAPLCTASAPGLDDIAEGATAR